MDLRSFVGRLLGLVRPERGIIVGNLVLTMGSVAAVVAGPKILGNAIDLVFDGIISRSLPAGATKAEIVGRERAEGKSTLADMLSRMDLHPGHGIDFGAVGRDLGLVALVYLAGWVLGALSGRLTATIVQKSMRLLREQAQAKLARLPLSYFDGRSRGEVLSRVTNDIDNVGQTLQQTLGQVVSSGLTIIALVAVMIWVSWPLALIALVTVPLSVVVTRLITKRSKPQFIAQWAATGQLNGQIEDVFTGHAMVKTFGRQQEATAVFRDQNERLHHASFEAQYHSGLIQPAVTFIGNANYMLVAVVGGLLIASGALSFGAVQAFIQYTRRFGQALTQLASVSNLLQSGVASFGQVTAFLDEPELTPGPVKPSDIGVVRGRVCFEHVCFRYQPNSRLIEDLSLVAEPGQTVAIVGRTGAGKTTLVNLLMRFYELTGGRITVDGVDTVTMTRERLRSLTGMVLQDTWLFGGTVAENIAYGADGISRERIVEAARAAHVDHFVRTLPDGYDTVISEEGAGISAGERQLIAIARALLVDPPVLILDEATSAVDTRTELVIQHAMNELRRGRTSFVIAHRLSTIRDADVILVLNAGQIVEQGTHEELFARGGAYWELYEAQFAPAWS
jgi:ATP-binding cassette subfamily B protein